MYFLVDDWNKSANVRRRGACDYHTSNLESLAFANSLAEALGSELPFPDVSLAPTTCYPCEDESLGFELGSAGFDLSPDANEGLDSDEIVETDDNETNTAALEAEDDLSATDAAEVARIQELLQDIQETQIRSAPRNSLEAFSRMTGENPWLPFVDDQSERAIAEKRLFDEMKGNFKQNVSPSTPTYGYQAFSKAWCEEVGQRYLARLAGVVDDESTPSDIIYSKTAKQLADYYDRLQEQAQVAALSTEESILRQREVNRTIRGARQNVVTPAVLQVQPMRYAHPGIGSRVPLGAPLVLNTRVAFPSGALAMNAQATGGAAPFLPPILEPIQQIPSRTLPKGVFRKICRHCGRLKAEHHNSVSNQFGMGRCNFVHCARCLRPHPGMGLSCKAVPGPNVLLNDLISYDMKVKSILDS